MEEMRIWVHAGGGHYIGSCVMCMARTEAEATRLIREVLDRHGLEDEPVDLRWHRADIPGVFHIDTGDY